MGAEHQTPTQAPASERPSRTRGTEPIAPAQPTTIGPLPVGTWPPRLSAAPAGRIFRQAAIAQLQRTHGNAFVGKLLDRHAEDESLLQRHPEGAAMTHDPVEAASEIANPPPLPASGGVPGAAAPAAPDGATPEAGTAAPATGEAETASTEAPAAAGETTGTPPAPATAKVMDLKKAEEVLTKSYGTSKTIVPGNIVMLADREATWKKYDEVAKGATNPHTKLPWKDGDAKTYIPGLDGFADKGTVYVNEQTTLATATAHEMLHNNTAAGFRAAVGETINEGATEYLAIKALTAAGVSTSSGTAYPSEVAFVKKLIIIVGEDTLIKAYFGGAATLTAKFDEVQGAGEFAKMKPFAEAKNWTEADKLVTYNPKEI